MMQACADDPGTQCGVSSVHGVQSKGTFLGIHVAMVNSVFSGLLVPVCLPNGPELALAYAVLLGKPGPRL